MIIVTSGHVDHGKSALLRALTGVDTAHLPEEKKRGMTIDLGYAYLPLPNGKVLGFIDVPGHEKFLANMLAGVGGVRYAMLIVAADEGIQRQTREHLAILRHLPLQQIIVVFTKSDRVEQVQIDTLQAQLKQEFPFLTDSPQFVTSAQTLDGVDSLREYLASLTDQVKTNSPFRYAIDRVFSVKGAGMVVTGTAFGGMVHIDDELVLSNGGKVRVKAIHAQNQVSQCGKAGERLALNIHLADEKRLPIRGDWLFSELVPNGVTRLSVQVSAATDLKEGQAVHIYHAASRTTGKLTLLETKHCLAGQRVLAELILQDPLFVAFGDTLILRSGDAKCLLGGAQVLEIHSPKRHKRTAERLALLHQLAQSENVSARLARYLQNNAVEHQALKWLEQLSDNELTQELTHIDAKSWQNWVFLRDYQTYQTDRLLDTLAQYHQQHNDQLGLGKARLYRIAALHQPENLIYHFIRCALDAGLLSQTRGWLHLPNHSLQFSAQESALWDSVKAEFAREEQALWVRDIAQSLGRDESEMRQFMYKAGKLGYAIAIVKDRFFLNENIESYAQIIKQILDEQGEISVNQLRDKLGFGRKLTVQLMEYYDRSGFLRRKGNVHILRDKEMF